LGNRSKILVQNIPYDQRVARVLVRPLARTPLTPNQITVATLVLALAGAGLFATGHPVAANWGAGLFVLARFLDHFDGELARLTGKTSRLGYYLDYFTGGVSYAALFAGIGIGLSHGTLGGFALLLAAAGMVAALASLFFDLEIDKLSESGKDGTDRVGYPGYAGFELEDGMYLLAPVTWLGWLTPFFVAAGIGAAIYCLWKAWFMLNLWTARRHGNQDR
jgi:phosphatidylglycerophosphate synthase